MTTVSIHLQWFSGDTFTVPYDPVGGLYQLKRTLWNQNNAWRPSCITLFYAVQQDESKDAEYNEWISNDRPIQDGDRFYIVVREPISQEARIQFLYTCQDGSECLQLRYHPFGVRKTISFRIRDSVDFSFRSSLWYPSFYEMIFALDEMDEECKQAIFYAWSVYQQSIR